MSLESFPQNWTARILTTPPLIAPARQYIYPQHIPGEEDAMNRGALLLDIKPAAAPNFLATCALGFRDPSLPTGIFACPRPEDLLAIAGGYAYLIDTQSPDHCLHLPLRPVTQILPAPAAGVILLAGFHTVLAIDANGIRWQSARLSWEGITLNHTDADHLHGTGWNLNTDREVPFTVDLLTGAHQGGGFTD
ncbi:MAG: hypothetical protein ABR971_08795 [Acidobacteriaceae bacterium]|jgi:hypothetical protein